MKWSLKKDSENSNQNNQVPQMPPELNNYYRAEKRDRMWGVWILGFASVVAVVCVSILLYWGGRWAWNRFIDNDDTTVVIDDSNDIKETVPATVDVSGINAVDEDQDTDTSSSSNIAEDEEESQGVVTSQAAVTEIPNTGPGEVVAVFLAVTFLAYIGNLKFARERS